MIFFSSEIEKFDKMGEKTGWTYVFIPFDISEKINPKVKKSYRVKGTIDKLPIRQTSLLPMGDGNFILPLKADLRKKLKKQQGEKVKLALEIETQEFQLSNDFFNMFK